VSISPIECRDPRTGRSQQTFSSFDDCFERRLERLARPEKIRVQCAIVIKMADPVRALHC
jgi:hypothetical protein